MTNIRCLFHGDSESDCEVEWDVKLLQLDHQKLVMMR